MKNLNKVGKALLIIVCFIGLNILGGMFLFKETMDSYHLTRAISGGIGSGLIVAYLSNRKKNRATFQSKA
jgi:hypothetical protein